MNHVFIILKFTRKGGDMKNIIKWLVEVEDRAMKIYEKSAGIFISEKEFAEFLLHLCREENMHGELMKRASEIIGDTSEHPSLTFIDDKIREGVDDYFSPCEKKIDTKEITKDDVINCIINTEFSEWNNLFLYVTNTLKHGYKEFNASLSKI